ncbi:uncharacterized protein LOC124937808 [Impatiens glandulifera]|uniref:uncharacterized protein LOC124937808 n=1 Tax=Impatiens glandulifera TaxID=253017 RepID=UPI001FB107DC|nr:uncharacterized protein LOC124937808 [Impatiens glandulifera]
MEHVVKLKKMKKKPTSPKAYLKKKPIIKVTYISNPMKVRANNESEFRAIVQELTGKNSTVAVDTWPELEETTVHDHDHDSMIINGVLTTTTTTPDSATVEQEEMIEIARSTQTQTFEYNFDDEISSNSLLLDNLNGFQYYWGTILA